MIGSTKPFVVGTFGFVLLGIATTIFGVIWPSVAEDLDRSIGELGYVTLAYGAGYTASSLLSGRLASRWATGTLLIGAASIATTALTLLTAAPGWPALLIATALLGSAGGQIDAGTNTYIAVRYGSRAMSFLHGAFGVGAIVGPLLITTLFVFDLSWRVGFAVLASCELLYLLGLWLYARSLTTPAQAQTAQTRSTAGARKALFWSVAVFFLYAGMATGLGAWVFTFLTEDRGVSETSGGLIVTAYWAGFTLSRILLGIIGERANPSNVLVWSGAATFAALAVFWMAPTGLVGTLAFVVAGFAHGPVFPFEMLLTPTRFGDSLTSTVVGYEIAAANVGGATISGIIGLLVDRYGLDVVPGVLLIVALGVWGSVWMLRETSDRERTPGRAVTTPPDGPDRSSDLR